MSLVVVWALAIAAIAAQSAPPLPQLSLETFPPAARAAIAEAHGAAVRNDRDGRAAGTLGRVLHAWEQWDTAHEAYLRAQALEPRAFEWHYLDAVVLQRLARHGEAAERLRAALVANPAYLPARVKLAEALFEAGELAASRGLFEALAAEPAAAPAAQVGLGRIDAAEGRHAAAIGHFERAVSLFPELAAAYYGLSRSYRATGRAADADRALEQHRRYGARWPAIEDPVLGAIAGLRDDARAELQRGIALAASGDVAAAIVAHEAALLRDPTLVQAHANLLSLYGRARNWPKAEAHYRAALDAGLRTADVYYDYAVVQAMQEKWQPAKEAYQQAIAINPAHANARNNLGQLLERERDAEGALAQYTQAVDAQPTFRVGRFNLGRMLLVLGRPDQAVAHFAMLQQPVDAETPRYLFALSTAYVRAGKTAEGVKLGNEARRLALEYGQTDFAAVIAAELAKLK
jgi:tetratricopeptide (TPR) repeat protein